MAAKRGELVPRPPKKIEYEIRYATADAAKGWQGPRCNDPQSASRGLGLSDANPPGQDTNQLPAARRTRHDHPRGQNPRALQHKPTLQGTARIWFFVEDRTVYLEQVHTSHPNETK